MGILHLTSFKSVYFSSLLVFVDVAMAVGKKGFSKEDELLLQDFSKNVSTKSSALFYGNAFIVSAIPIWLFWRVHSMEPVSSAPLFAVVTLVATWLVAFAYRNTKHLLSILVFASFYVLKTLGATLNYIVSMAISAGIIALISTRTSA